MGKTCKSCKKEVEQWNEKCGGCGFTLVLEPDEKRKARFLKGPSLGALFFTQGWAFGARLYAWFLLSLVPVFGLVALIVCLFFGRRWSWKYGGWSNWEEFTRRMRMMDILGGAWILILASGYLIIKFT
ncbi:MAG: hypothetical protein P8J32_00055 [bacterium]|jgi:hypothetical protein|nr:hypothetical protein [bacterium]